MQLLNGFFLSYTTSIMETPPELGSIDLIKGESYETEIEDGALHTTIFDMYGRTEIADPRNKNNEDAVYIDPDARIIAGADGLGGHPHGELAAAFASYSFGTRKKGRGKNCAGSKSQAHL